MNQRNPLGNLIERSAQIILSNGSIDFDNRLRKPAKADGAARAKIQRPDDPVDSRQISSSSRVRKRKAQDPRLARITAARFTTDFVSSGFSPAFIRFTPNFFSIACSSDTNRSESIPSDGKCVSVVTLPGFSDISV